MIGLQGEGLNHCTTFPFFFLGETSTIGGCFFLRLFCGFVVPGAPEGSTGRRL